jgi:hypothetical protein
MRVASIVTLLTAVLTGSASIPATAASGGLPFLQASAVERQTPRSLFVTSQRRNAFQDLFTGQLKLDPRPPLRPKAPSLGQPPAQRSAQGSRVVCGMTLIPLDPKIDAAIRHPIPENGPKFTIQTILPPACRQ